MYKGRDRGFFTLSAWTKKAHCVDLFPITYWWMTKISLLCATSQKWVNYTVSVADTAISLHRPVPRTWVLPNYLHWWGAGGGVKLENLKFPNTFLSGGFLGNLTSKVSNYFFIGGGGRGRGRGRGVLDLEHKIFSLSFCITNSLSHTICVETTERSWSAPILFDIHSFLLSKAMAMHSSYTTMSAITKVQSVIEAV